MSRPSWDPFPHANSSFHHANNVTSTTITPTPVLNPPTINAEDARILDPSYLSSFSPVNNYSNHGYLGFGPSLSKSGSHNYNGGGNNQHTHLDAIPYIDAQGVLHDPDYRPFPLIQNTKSGPSPFALRRPYWETEEVYENEGVCSEDEDEDETNGGTPTTPTSTTPFICYFLQTHPLKRGGPPRMGGVNGGGGHGSQLKFSSRDNNGHGRTRRGKLRGHVKLGSAHMYTTMASGTITRTTSENKSQSYSETPTPTTTGAPALPLINHNVQIISASPPPADYDIIEKEKEKERKIWGGLLWSRGGKKDGIDKD